MTTRWGYYLEKLDKEMIYDLTLKGQSKEPGDFIMLLRTVLN